MALLSMVVVLTYLNGRDPPGPLNPDFESLSQFPKLRGKTIDYVYIREYHSDFTS